uniref:hypothetical protein n=2 Tax=Clavibacter michiganensis TaxID=28447 RepID=UPI002931295F
LEQDSTVTHVLGPVWAVNGHMINVSPGEDPRRVVLEALVHASSGTNTRRAIISDGPRATRLQVRSDGSVIAEGHDADAWTAAGEPLWRPVVIGAHAGAGASTWALLLGLAEANPSAAGRAAAVLVCRSTPAGIEATKKLVRTLGPATVAAALVVADAPGRPIPAALREQRILAGAVPVIPVPWLPRLRAVAEISPGLVDQLRRPVQRITQALEDAQPSNEEKNK